MDTRWPVWRWAMLALAVTLAGVARPVAAGGEATAYQALGLQPGASAGEAVDSFVDLLLLQRSLEENGEELAASYQELKAALLAVLDGGAAASCPVSYGDSSEDSAPKKRGSRGKERQQARQEEAAAVPEVMDGRVVGQAITQLNAGDTTGALTLLNRYLAVNPKDITALMARGTAHALSGRLQEAKSDFGEVIALQPQLAEGYKRRSQTLSALGDNEAALEDIFEAERYIQDSPEERAYLESAKGMLHNKLQDYVACEASYRVVTQLQPTNAIAWNMLALCCANRGNIKDSIPYYQRSIALDPTIREVHTNYADALKETGDLVALEKAVRAPELQGKKDKLAVKAFLHLTESHQVAGNHAYCVKLLDEYNPATCGELKIHCYFLRGHCMQALGQYREAIGEYGLALQTPTDPGTDKDVITMQVLSFYMKEISVYYGNHADAAISSWNMDQDLDPRLKEAWTKRSSPNAEFVQTYQLQTPLSILDSAPPQRDHPELPTLLEAAAVLGPMIHYRHSGFVANHRTQRMAGLAIIEAAQAVQAAVAGHKAGQPFHVANAGSSAPHGDRNGTHQFGWRDMYDIIVRWRQLTEPNDVVVWADQLTKEGLAEGFGAHTPIVIGQYVSQRYGGNLARGIELFKQEMASARGFYDVDSNWVALSDSDIANIASVTNLSTLFNVTKRSAWTTIMLNSTREPGITLEATRATMLRREGRAESYDFSIRTPVTPPRIMAFGAEMEFVWSNFLEAAAKGDQPGAALWALRLAYYWYNLMALARGTAAVGYIGILATFLALDMPIVEFAPKGFQLDWAAIFNRDPSDFIASLSWIYPAAALGQPPTPRPACEEGRRFCSPADISASELPSVLTAIPTLRQRVRLLNDAAKENLRVD